MCNAITPSRWQQLQHTGCHAVASDDDHVEPKVLSKPLVVFNFRVHSVMFCGVEINKEYNKNKQTFVVARLGGNQSQLKERSATQMTN